MRRALAACMLVFLAGCMSLSPGAREPDRYFILDAAPGRQAASPVRVTPTSAASFYDTQDMVYNRTPGTRAYYQFNHWTERPQRAIHEALGGRFPSASPNLVLNTHLQEIYHDATERPGTARIVLMAELVDPTTRKVLARRSFERSAPAVTYDAPGAVQGFRQALGALLDDLVAWADGQAQAKAP